MPIDRAEIRQKADWADEAGTRSEAYGPPRVSHDDWTAACRQGSTRLGAGFSSVNMDS